MPQPDARCASENSRGSKAISRCMGGDHVFDALAVDNNRAKLVFDLYQKTEQSLQMKLYNTIGNHDLFGINTLSGIVPNDPGYGKNLYEDRFGQKTYYSFDHKGYHFFVLDSVQPTADRMWNGRIDEEQFAWLADDLKRVGPNVPVIGITHVPLVTAFANYDDTPRAPQKYNTLSVGNSAQVLKMLEELQRRGGAARPYPHQRSGELQAYSVHYQRRSLRKLVEGVADGMS